MLRALEILGVSLFLRTLPQARGQGPAPVGTNETGPLSQFKSRPDIYAPFLNVTLFEEDLVTPGYIFLAPYQTFQEGLYIYDNRGNLVWSGFGATGGGPSHNFHLCQVNGSDHLCFISAAQDLGFGRGYGIILDKTYTTVATLKSQAGIANLDEHEFNVVDDGKAVLLTIYNPEPYDLSDYNITGGQGWHQNSYFQKIEIGTNRLLFEWSAIDHISPVESTVLPNTTEVSGSGFSPTSPWDWFHINSVDQTADGNFLISSRHTSTIYKVSGHDGHVIWRLGGNMSDFTFPEGLNFSSQHDARVLSENASTTILSLFDNGSNGYVQSASYSSGMVLQLDHNSSSVTLLRSYIAPNQFISASQGNLQLLGPDSAWDTAHTFLSWGSNAYISEYTNDGTIVQQAHFATIGSMSYRGFKFNFTSNPTDSPALYTYAHNDSAATTFYMSWNGATQASQWRLYGASSRTGPFDLIDTVPKTGFETTFTAPQFYAWGIVESLDVDNKPLRNSSRPIRTFVPSSALADACDVMGCATATEYEGGKGTSVGTAVVWEEESSAPEVGVANSTSSASGSTSASASASATSKGAAAANRVGKDKLSLAVVAGFVVAVLTMH